MNTSNASKIVAGTTVSSDWYTCTTSNIIGNIASSGPSMTLKIDDNGAFVVVDANHMEVDVKKPEVAADTKTILFVNGKRLEVKSYENGFYKTKRDLMPDIKDVKQLKNVVMVTFADGTTTKAVASKGDTFSLEQGISICITKKLLGNDGSNIYNKLIDRALKVKQQNEEAEKQAEEKKEAAKKKIAKAVAKSEKRKNRKREEAIELQKEAYIRAMKEINGGK